MPVGLSPKTAPRIKSESAAISTTIQLVNVVLALNTAGVGDGPSR